MRGSDTASTVFSFKGGGGTLSEFEGFTSRLVDLQNKQFESKRAYPMSWSLVTGGGTPSRRGRFPHTMRFSFGSLFAFSCNHLLYRLLRKIWTKIQVGWWELLCLSTFCEPTTSGGKSHRLPPLNGPWDPRLPLVVSQTRRRSSAGESRCDGFEP